MTRFPFETIEPQQEPMRTQYEYKTRMSYCREIRNLSKYVKKEEIIQS